MANLKAKKKKTSKAVSRKTAKKNGSKRRSSDGKNGSKPKPGNGKGKNRAVLKEDRQGEVLKLRFIQRWSIKDLATHFGVNARTIERDIEDARKIQLKRAKKNLENEVRYIVEDLKLSFDEKVKFLWNEFADIHGKEKSIGDLISDVQAQINKVKDPDNITSLARQLAKLVDSQQSCLQKRLHIIAQVTETESCHVDMLKKLGIAGPSLGDDEDDAVYLIQIKERLKNREKNAQKNTADSSGGGSDGKPSDKAQ